MNFNDFDQQEEIKMSEEEENSHKKFFSRICLPILVYVLVGQLLSMGAFYVLKSIAPELLKSDAVLLAIDGISKYVIAFPIAYFLIKPIQSSIPSNRKLSIKELIKGLSITSLLMYVGQYISLILMDTVQTNFVGQQATDTSADIANLLSVDRLVVLLALNILAPIIEGLLFRKLLVDRLRPYGEKIAVFFSALLFALSCGDLYSFFTAFFVGAALSYIYVKTGKLIYTVVIHMFISVFFNTLSVYLLSLIDLEQILKFANEGAIPNEYIAENMTSLTVCAIYGLIFYALIFIGIFNINRQLYRLRFEKGRVQFPKGKSLEITLFNIGAIALVTVCIIIIMISTFSFAIA